MTVASSESPDGSRYAPCSAGTDRYVDAFDRGCASSSRRLPEHVTGGQETNTFVSQQWAGGVERGLEGQQRWELQDEGGVNGRRHGGGGPSSGKNQRDGRRYVQVLRESWIGCASSWWFYR